MTRHWPAALFFLLSVLPSAALAQAAPSRPLDPVTAIIEAFKTHDVVALGEGNHTNEQGAAFRHRLYRDPRFQAVVNDIVVEHGNGRHQAIMDRYIAGEDVPEKELRLAWTETTQPHDIWDRDIYADTFRTIREINRTRPKERHMRVLLGDTPYTYDPANPGAPANRTDSFTADLILRETIAKKRKAMTVYGEMHHLRRQAQFPPAPGQPVRPPFTFYYPAGLGRMTQQGPNGPETFDVAEAIGGTMQEQYNAVLYLGPRSGITYASLSRSLCADPEHVEMRAKRMSAGMPPPPPGLTPGPSPADAFRLRCKAVLDGGRKAPTPGLDALARRIIEGVGKGEPPLDIMGPGLTQAVQTQRESLMQRSVRTGPLQSLTFTGAAPNGGDIYRALFANNVSTATIIPGPDGKITGFLFGPPLQTPEQRAATFKANDGNGDGRLGKAEYGAVLAGTGQTARLDNLFAQLDADQDGLITPKEFETETH